MVNRSIQKLRRILKVLIIKCQESIFYLLFNFVSEDSKNRALVPENYVTGLN